MVSPEAAEGRNLSHPTSTEAGETEKSTRAIPFLLLPVPGRRQPSNYHFCQLLPESKAERWQSLFPNVSGETTGPPGLTAGPKASASGPRRSQSSLNAQMGN